MADNGQWVSYDDWKSRGGSASDYLQTYGNWQPSAPPPPEQGDVSRGFTVAMKQLPQLAGGSIYALGDSLGLDSWRDYGKDLYMRKSAEVEKLQKDTDSFSRNWEQGNFGDWVDFVKYGVGYTAGQALQSVATGGLGALAGRAGLQAAIKPLIAKQIGDAAIEVAAKQAGKEGLDLAAKQAMFQGLDAAAQKSATTIAERAVAQRFAAQIGAASALQGFNVTQELGQIYPEMVDEVKKQGREVDLSDRLRAFGSAGVAAAIETTADMLGLKQAWRGGAGASLGRRAAFEIPQAVGREAGTEALQTVVERYGAQQPIADAAGIRDIIDSAALGAIGGVGPGGVASLHRNKAASPLGQPPAPATEAVPGVPQVNQPSAGLDMRAHDQVTQQAVSDIGQAQNINDVLSAAIKSDAQIDSLHKMTSDQVAAQRFATPMQAETIAPVLGAAQTRTNELNLQRALQGTERAQNVDQASAAALAESQAPVATSGGAQGEVGVAPNVTQQTSTTVLNPAANVAPEATPSARQVGYQAAVTPEGDFAVIPTNVADDSASLAREVQGIRQQIQTMQASGSSTGRISADFNAKVAPHEMVKGGSAMVGIASAVGAKVRFFTPTSPTTIQGFVGRDGTIWASTKSHNLLAEVVGHELDHFIEKSFPEVHGPYRAAVQQFISQEQLAQVQRTHGEAGAAEKEVVANLSGTAMAQPEFWGHLKATNPGLFSKMVDTVKQFFDYLIGKLSGSADPMARISLEQARAASKYYATMFAEAAQRHAETAAKESTAQAQQVQKNNEVDQRLVEAVQPHEGPVVGAKEAQQEAADKARFAKNMGMPEGAQAGATAEGLPLMSAAETAHHSALQPRDSEGKFNGPPSQNVGTSSQVPTERNAVQGSAAFNKREQPSQPERSLRSEYAANNELTKTAADKNKGWTVGRNFSVADRQSFTSEGVANLTKESHWAVLTAEDPNNKKASAQQNKAAMEELHAWLRREGVDAIDVVGKYDGTQNSVIVYGRKVDAAWAERARARFDQESVLIPEGLLYANNEVHPADGTSRIDPNVDNYYTELPDGGRWQYGINFEKKVPLSGQTQFSATKTSPDEEEAGRLFPTAKKISEKLRGAPIAENTPQNMRRLVKTVRAIIDKETATNHGAEHWYRDSMNRAMRLVESVFPEVATNPDARDAFIASLAITSNGLTIAQNVRAAFQVFEGWKEDGRLPAKEFGVRGKMIAATLTKYNQLIDELGAEDARAFLASKMTAKELLLMAEGVQESVGTPSGMEVYGSLLFGPKIGNGFYSNLSGRLDMATMDRWFYRTWGRITNTLIRVRGSGEEVLAENKIRDSEIEFAQSMMEEVVRQERASGKDITVADVQAILWYAEKKVYDSYGANYETAQPTDYATEIGKYVDANYPDRANARGAESGGGLSSRPEAQPAEGQGISEADDGSIPFSVSAEPAAGPGGGGDLPGSAAVTGIHYGKLETPALSGRAYGTGIRGAEAERLKWTKDDRIKRRVYFYIAQEGKGLPRAESGLGPWVYRADLRNMYDPGVSPRLDYSKKIDTFSEDGDIANAFESAVVDAGYNGYLNRDARQAVVLNRDVPVTKLGNRATERINFSAADAGKRYVIRELGTYRSSVVFQTGDRDAARAKLRILMAQDPEGRYVIEHTTPAAMSFSIDDSPDAETASFDENIDAAPAPEDDTIGLNNTVPDKIAQDLQDYRREAGLNRSAATLGAVGRGWVDKARDPSLFIHPFSNQPSLAGVASDMGGGSVRVKSPRPARAQEAGPFPATRVYEIIANGKPAWVYEDAKDNIVLNAAVLEQGKSKGALLYQIVGTWAANAGKKFIGDPGGLSDRALFRRTINMMSNALRTGTTDHLQLHQDQRDAGIQWRKGNDDFNIGSMATWIRDTLAIYAPQSYDKNFDATNPYRGLGTFRPSAGVAPEVAAGGENTQSQVRFTDQILQGVAGVEGGGNEAGAAGAGDEFRAYDSVRQGLVEPRLYSAAPFYSELSKQVETASASTLPAAGWESMINSLVNKGTIKSSEVEWSGVKEWLKLQGKKVPKAEVTSFLNGNGVHVTETVLGGQSEFNNAGNEWQQAIDRAEADGDFDLAERIQRAWDGVNEETGSTAGMPKFADYQLPGGKNYRELLLTLPTSERQRNDIDIGERKLSDLTPEERARYFNFQPAERQFQSSHFDQPNILAHVRFNERTDTDGKKVLFIEELQSDWAQKGRKLGFAGEYTVVDEKNKTLGVFKSAEEAQAFADAGKLRYVRSAASDVPSAPFVTKTDAWVALSLKRMIRWAADHGFDRVAWTTGEQQANRYDLSKQVDDVLYTKNSDGTFNLAANIGMNRRSLASNVKPSDLERYVGKEIAKKIIDGKGVANEAADAFGKQYTQTALSGLDLKVGGEGMHSFYDQIVPKVANEVLKKMGGGRVAEVRMSDPRDANHAYRWQIRKADGALLSLPGHPDKAQFYNEADANRVLEKHPDWMKEPRRSGTKQPGFDITPALREKAAEGVPMFSIAGDSKRAGGYTPQQAAFFKRTGRDVTKPTLKERIAELRKDAGKKMAQGLVDAFAPIKEYSAKAYTLARLAKGTSGAFEVFLKHGKLSIVDGAYDGDMSGGFLDRVGVPLKGELEDFLWWVAANRAEQLSKEDREHLFKPEDIVAGKSLADGTTPFQYTLTNGKTTNDRAAIYRDSMQKFNEFHKNALDMAEQSGLIDGDTRPIWEKEFYVPFYRESENGGFIGGRLKSGLIRQEAFKKLKGGEGKLNSDLLANTLQNWNHLIDASMKNRAAMSALESASQMGVATEADEATVRAMGSSINQRSDVAWFLDSGRKRYFIVGDKYLMAAIGSLEYAGLKGPLMNALTSFKHYLTMGVTASPAFKVRNLIRDSIQSMAVGELSYNPIANVVEGYKASSRDSQDYVSALASGGLIRFGTMLEGNEASRARQLIKQGVKDHTILDSEGKVQAFYDQYIEPAIQAYNELGNRSEEINRATLFKQLKSQGVPHDQAALMARDLLDFSMQGSWAGVRFLTQVVPFMNARMQGLYKLGRAAHENPQRLATVLGATALFSIALLAAYSGDPDWDKREEYDLDNYWWFKFGGTAFRIPKPFEIGAIASLAERGVQMFIDPQMTGSRLSKSVLGLVSSNLSMNPVPQLVKPLLDIYSNTDSFTGRPIQTMGMEKLATDYRYTSRTSMAARALSTAGQSVAGATGLASAGYNFLSPVQIDHLAQGYFGWLGTFVVASSDMMVRPLTSEPSRPEMDYVKTLTQGIARTLPEDQSRYVTQLYDQAAVLDQAYGTYQALKKEGRSAEAASYLLEHRDEIVRSRQVDRIKQTLSKYGQQIRIIERSNLSPSEKRSRISDIRSSEDRLSRAISG